MLLFYYIFIIGSWFSYPTTIVPPLTLLAPCQFILIGLLSDPFGAESEI